MFRAPAAHHLLPLPLPPSVLLLEPINEVSKLIKFNIKKSIHPQTTDKPSLGSFVSWSAPVLVVVAAHMWRHLNIVGVVLIPY